MLPSEPRTLVSWLNMFHATGNLQPSFHGSGHYVHTPENIEWMRWLCNWIIKYAVQHAVAMRILDRKVCWILHKDLKFQPYKIQVVQQLKPQDQASQLHFTMKFGAILQENDNVLNNLFMSEEAHFHLNGTINKQNFQYWSHTNPMALHERPLHCEKWLYGELFLLQS